METAFQCASPARLLGPCSFAAVVSSTSNSYSSFFLFHGLPDSAVGALSTHASQTDLQPCSMKSLMVESTLLNARSVVFNDHTNSFCVEHSSTVGFAAVIVSKLKPIVQLSSQTFRSKLRMLRCFMKLFPIQLRVVVVP